MALLIDVPLEHLGRIGGHAPSWIIEAIVPPEWKEGYASGGEYLSRCEPPFEGHDVGVIHGAYANGVVCVPASHFGALHVAGDFVEDGDAIACSGIDDEDARVFRAAGVEDFAGNGAILCEESDFVFGPERELQRFDDEVGDLERSLAGVLEDEKFAARAMRCVGRVKGGYFERDIFVLQPQ